ncbi:hypothetical protein [Pelotalea chapellei]|uniref:Uncharacterized protein n=1 Tax=Pelotalea chapellei TaxID=44671 RepID=A0ABS5UCN9_9BACT|nr:hypothetical protein [Pelotalea chapellei]MBT1073473.1 hypothetical protein [Pelotalea chapellei]
MKEGKYLRFRCHIGHSYLPESLLADQTRAVTTALYSAMRTLEEKIASLRRIAQEIKEKLPKENQRYEQQVSELIEQKIIIQQLIRNL